MAFGGCLLRQLPGGYKIHLLHPLPLSDAKAGSFVGRHLVHFQTWLLRRQNGVARRVDDWSIHMSEDPT